MTEPVIIHTDGACRGNPGRGGWGVLLCFRGSSKYLRGAERMTTNNRMELQAAVEALRALQRPCKVTLYTDSRYVHDGMRKWVKKWKQNDWRTSDRQPVKNRDLWETLDELQARHAVTWHWVKGHAGNPGNETADKLANRAIDEL